MELLPNDSADDGNYLVPYGENPLMLENARQSYVPPSGSGEEGGPGIKVGLLIRKHEMLQPTASDDVFAPPSRQPQKVVIAVDEISVRVDHHRLLLTSADLDAYW